MSGPDVESGDNRFRRVLEAFVGVSFTDGNAVRRLRNGVEIFPAMLDAIRLARTRIDFVTFVYWTGDIAQQMAYALSERARAGVEVRILLDAVGAGPMNQELIDQMADAGADVAWFRPVARWKVWETDHRTHRKILVVDNRVAFTGGVGIAEEWEGDARHSGEWRDSHFEIRGPAIDSLRSAFISDWRDAQRPMFTGDEVPDAPEPAGEVAVGVVDASAQIELNRAGRMFEAVTAIAEGRLWISTPYFNPSERLAELLARAAEGGVDVRIMIPGPYIDKRVCLVMAEEHAEDLLGSGVQIYQYQPTMLHLKQIIADDTLSVFGSVNINKRSMLKDEEVAVVTIDTELNDLLAQDFLVDLERCEHVTDTASLDRSLLEKTIGTALHPLDSEL